jgi:RND family efflux transporter MFP subunit
MKRILYIALLIVFVLLIIGALVNNRREIERTAMEAQREVDRIPVRAFKLNTQNFQPVFAVSGTAVPFEELIVLSETQGKIEKIYFETGERVGKNDLVIKVNDELLRAEFGIIKANFEKAEKDKKRYERLAEKEAVSPDQIEKIDLAYESAKAKYLSIQKRLKDTEIRAPFAGTINQFFTKENSLTGGGKPLFELVNTSRLKMKLELTENEYLRLAHVERLAVIHSLFPDDTIRAEIVHKAVKANPLGLFPVEISFDSETKSIPGGLSATAVFMEKMLPGAIVLDKDLLTGDNKILVVEGGEVRVSEIVFEELNRDKILVESGLQEGDSIIYSGKINISEGRKVRIVK